LYTETAIALLVLHIVHGLSHYGRPPTCTSRGGLAAGSLRRACEYMRSRMGDAIALDEIARVVGLSTSHFSFAFKQSTGLAPYTWLRRQRVQSAKGLLHDPTLPLTSIALMLGFANQSAFGVAFKRETGLTPTAWRRSHT
jgi:AraC family transcriptional regulator